jgi:tetraacyldisaccharide 4'-kinase
LREPLDAAADADALLVENGIGSPFSPQQPVFAFSRRIAGPSPDRPAFAFAGIAKPERFYRDLQNAGWQLTGRRSFGDHHRYTAREIEEVVRAADRSGAAAILTTEKDFVRLGAAVPGTTEGRIRIVAVQLEVVLDPSFAPWLEGRLREARAMKETRA